MAKKHRKRSKQTRQHPRRPLVPHEPIPDKTSYWLFERAESLSPSVRTMDNYVAGKLAAVEIIESWAFRYPITRRAYVAA